MRAGVQTEMPLPGPCLAALNPPSEQNTFIEPILDSPSSTPVACTGRRALHRRHRPFPQDGLGGGAPAQQRGCPPPPERLCAGPASAGAPAAPPSAWQAVPGLLVCPAIPVPRRTQRSAASSPSSAAPGTGSARRLLTRASLRRWSLQPTCNSSWTVRDRACTGQPLHIASPQARTGCRLVTSSACCLGCSRPPGQQKPASAPVSGSGTPAP